MPTDPFTSQRRVDDFRRGLGNLGGRVERHAALDAILDSADRYGWSAERFGQFVAHQLRNNASPGPGLVVRVASDLCDRPEPAKPSSHQLEAVHDGKRAHTRFRQPIPACGSCDGGPGRWLDVTPPGHRGQPRVIHCPNCWTAPPGYVAPSDRSRPEGY